MSEKVINNKFKADIDRMIEQGQSSRSISSWLAKRGEYISHVTISAYRNSERDSESITATIEYESTDEAKEKLTEIILQKAIESPNSPTKLRAYVDAYLKLSNQIEKDKEATPNNTMEEFRYLSHGEKLERLKKSVLKNLSFFHSYYRLDFLEATSEKQKEFHLWSEQVEQLMAPIFNGELPSNGGQYVKC
jgi:hypothetical protein